MERKQVSLDLDTPCPSSNSPTSWTVQCSGTSNPKTNSALQLARALRYSPQILGQASNIAKQMGAEAAANVENVEDAMEDEESKGILGYNKAYQHGLVKRYFDMNKSSIQERFQRLSGQVNLPTGAGEEQRLASVTEFTKLLDEERDAFNQELMDKFGGDEHREQALGVLSSSFVDSLYDATVSQYKENLEQQSQMFMSAEAQSLFESKGVAAGLELPRCRDISTRHGSKGTGSYDEERCHSSR